MPAWAFTAHARAADHTEVAETDPSRDLAPPLPPTRILSISPAPEDHNALRRILADACWDIRAACTCFEAAAWLANHPVDIVICERDLPDGSWRDLLRYLDEFAEAPFLIVASTLADAYLWAEVLNLRGYGVLAKPFDSEEVRRVVGHAGVRGASRHRAAVSGA